MTLIPGKDRGGQAVWQLPDGKIVPVSILLDESGFLSRILNTWSNIRNRQQQCNLNPIVV